MVTFRRKKSPNADRGATAEKAAHTALDLWALNVPAREYNRLLDTKAAGRTVKAAVADFEFYSSTSGVGIFGLIEVKQTEHEYRLARDKVTQLPAMRKRAQCGGQCIVLVLHSTLGLWRAVGVKWMEEFGDKGSWNLKGIQPFPTARAALLSHLPEVFG